MDFWGIFWPLVAVVMFLLCLWSAYIMARQKALLEALLEEPPQETTKEGKQEGQHPQAKSEPGSVG